MATYQEARDFHMKMISISPDDHWLKFVPLDDNITRYRGYSVNIEDQDSESSSISSCPEAVWADYLFEFFQEPDRPIQNESFPEEASHSPNEDSLEESSENEDLSPASENVSSSNRVVDAAVPKKEIDSEEAHLDSQSTESQNTNTANSTKIPKSESKDTKKRQKMNRMEKKRTKRINGIKSEGSAEVTDITPQENISESVRPTYVESDQELSDDDSSLSPVPLPEPETDSPPEANFRKRRTQVSRTVTNNFGSTPSLHKYATLGFEILKFGPTSNGYHISQPKRVDSHESYTASGSFSVVVDPKRVHTYSINSFVLPITTGESPKQMRARIEENNIGENGKKKRKLKNKYDYTHFDIPQITIVERRLQNRSWRGEYDRGKHSGLLMEISKDQSPCEIQRTRYLRRDLSMLAGHSQYLTYEKNPEFDLSKPYLHEFTRIERIPGSPAGRAGLCPFCEHINFFDLKSSAYGIHLNTEHGVDTDGYLFPDPGYAGQYFLNGTKCECIVCPACEEVFKLSTHKATKDRNRLVPFLRHFKHTHRIRKNKNSYFDEDDDVRAVAEGRK